MVQDSLGILQENTILGTKARIDGTFGDAVVAWDDSSVIMVDNHTHDTARAAVSNFGAYVSLESNQFLCQGFDLQGEPYSGDDFTFDDFGDNWCGCGAPQGPCQVISSQVGPPPPVGGLE